MNAYIITAHAVLSVICWGIVGLGATVAVFSPTVKDTTAERFALAAIAIGAFATACRVIRQGWVSEGGLFMSAALAFYVLAIAVKHWRGEPSTLPNDKTRPGDLRNEDGSEP
ncbi:hypothetical protein [Variovorax boronicumulans]|uniref:hypothetical protein n=1 Tax=Variovorax boronicumulans TaxID=436515 RepID=UPI001C5A4701